ncbi:YopX family protein [Staphylococcus pettenkoferi]|uniref:YopX family protein n=1 Tax=Staphylococcus pettenkoferi TaxID=170573 RepID=UPI0011A85647|nr:YopX family protein [Staphylococcus pettenkoferi]MCY1587590.1 YopX family protein [Staphylococcus pettenkoferi]
MMTKFRAWDKDREYMEYTDKKLIVSFGENGNVSVTDLSNIYSACEHMQNFELMQSTGLKDINGIEIYEGDIVHVNYKLSIVKYAKGSFYIEFIDFPKIIMLSDFYFKSYTNDLILKVQGNIYENPELLEDE